MKDTRETPWFDGMDEIPDGPTLPFPMQGPMAQQGDSVSLVGEGEDAHLTMNWRPVGEAWVLVETDPKRMLMRFIALADAKPDKYLDYARTWGPLWLCDLHGLPFTHPDELGEGCELTFSESIAHWRRLARRVRAIFRIATELHRTREAPHDTPRLGSENDWAAVAQSSAEAEATREWMKGSVSSLKEANEWLASYVNELLEWAAVVPHLAWREASPNIELRGSSNFSHIAAQLLFAVAGRPRAALCDNCGALYMPIRLPRTGQRKFCDKCGADKTIPNRFAQRDHRQRQRERKQNPGGQR